MRLPMALLLKPRSRIPLRAVRRVRLRNIQRQQSGHCKNRQRNVEEQIRANRQELQVMQVRLESMNIIVPELPEIGRYKVVCGNFHHRGHRNQQTKPCIMERCSSFTYCGIKDKHPEYTSEMNRMKCAIEKKSDAIKQLEEELEGINNFQSQSEHHFIKAFTPRMMNTGKATGADEIPAKALKIAAPYISQVLTKIFNTSYQNGHYPSLWKVARVIPLFKGGCRTERDNQRPISVLPCVSKIHESFVNSDLQEFAWDNGLIKPNQHAYAKNSSTTVALIMLVDSWKLAIDKGEKLVCAFLDLRKAFDTINHKVLLNKLMKYGVKDREYDWFANCLP
ncbi:Hypothetical predicted protein, partial [Paramuricea clavata]